MAKCYINKVKALVGAFGVLSVLFSVSGSSAVEPTRVGYVRLEKIVTVNEAESPLHEWSDRLKQFKTDIGNRYGKIEAEQLKFNKAKEEFESNQGKNKWVSESAREAQSKELVKMQNEIQTEMRYLESYREREVQMLQKAVFEKIEKGAQSLGSKLGVDLILYAGAFYVGKNVDITDELVAALNKEYDVTRPKEASAKAPATVAKPATPVAKK